MRILIYGLNFAPEITGVGKFTGEMAAYLSARGHQIRVVTSYPYYPGWKIQSHFQAWKYCMESWRPEGKEIEVFRCPLWVPSRPTGLRRILHLLSFAFLSFPVCLAQVFWKPNLVFCIAPTIFTAPTALLASALSGARSWLHIQDFEIGAAWSLGFVKGSKFIRRFVDGAFTFLMNRFDRVSTISDRMLASLKRAGVHPNKFFLLPNWVDLDKIHSSDQSNGFRQELNLTDKDVVVLFSGSMTRKQSLPTLVEAARLLADQTRIHFILCGEGDFRDKLQAQAETLANVHFLPLQPIDKFNHLLNLADIHVLPQMAASADLVMPSKITAMLASGRPVIATTTSNTALGELVEKNGVLTPPENPAALAEAIAYLARYPEVRAEMGRNSRKTAENQFSADAILSNLNSSLASFITV